VYVLIWKGLAEGFEGCVDGGGSRGIWRGLRGVVERGSGARIRDWGIKKKKPGGARRLDASIYEGEYSPFGRTCQDNNLVESGFYPREAGEEGEGKERFLTPRTAFEMT
jgi:hypothetical protein